jgi:hypothetical protein
MKTQSETLFNQISNSTKLGVEPQKEPGNN